MKTWTRRTATAVIASTLAGTAQAHHSISMFDISKAIWLKGEVVRYEPIAPHAMIAVEVTGDDGKAQLWVVEGPNPGRLNRILGGNGLSVAEDFLHTGATIEVCGFSLKEQWNPERMYPNTIWSSSRFVHGQVLKMPDGRLQSWGPYGKVENCVRPNDDTQTWADFLNTDPLAREFWCGGLSAYHSRFGTAPSEAFIDEVGRKMDNACE